jgi:hypothetical protein
MFFPGQQVEIKAAYNAETGERDIWDEYAGCAAEIVRHDGADVLVYVKAMGEVWVAASRIRAGACL